MKILLLTTHLNKGGIGIYTVSLARYLKKANQDVTVASSGGDLEPLLASSGICHVKFDIRTKAEFGIKMWRTLPEVIKLLKSGGFDIVHAQTRVTQVLARLADKFVKVPIVTTCHGFFKHNRLSRKVFPCWGDMTIAISDSVRDHLLRDFLVSPSKIVRVYNGIELGRYLAARDIKDQALMKSIGLRQENKIIGSIGRLSSVKGYKYLVEAFKGVSEKEPRARLVIVGEGPEEKALKEQIQSLSLEGKVILTPGAAPLEKYMEIFDVFCMPSVHEGLGLSVMEAMAAGKACVVSNVGGLAELITNEKDGILVPSEDPVSLSKALFRLLGDDEIRGYLAENARRKAEIGFSIEDSVERTIEVYKKVVERWKS